MTILYLNVPENRIEAILKRDDPANPFQTYCERLVVPDDFDLYVDYVNDQGEPRKRELTVGELRSRMTYRENRYASYPSIQEQLDMLYWDSQNGTKVWEARIAEIKSLFPKE